MPLRSQEKNRMSSTQPSTSPSYTPPDWRSIVQAHARIASRIHRTPVLTSSSLDAMIGARVFFKCDNLQRTGSFKIRGATNAIFSLGGEEAARGIVTQSSGNHGGAVACAGGWRGIPALDGFAQETPPGKIHEGDGLGGEVEH